MTKHHIDLTKLSNEQLRSYLHNAQRLGDQDLAIEIIREMHKRGVFPRKCHKLLPWNEERMAETLKSFADVAGTVVNSRRTVYTNGGGLRRRPKWDPDRMWVDSYSAIKRGGINAAFAGRIKCPGDQPEFELLVNGIKRFFELSELDDAFQEWKRIAAGAMNAAAA